MFETMNVKTGSENKSTCATNMLHDVQKRKDCKKKGRCETAKKVEQRKKGDGGHQMRMEVKIEEKDETLERARLETVAEQERLRKEKHGKVMHGEIDQK